MVRLYSHVGIFAIPNFPTISSFLQIGNIGFQSLLRSLILIGVSKIVFKRKFRSLDRSRQGAGLMDKCENLMRGKNE